MTEEFTPRPERRSVYSIQRGDYRRPKRVDLRKMEQATQNRPYYAAVAALEMCGVAPPQHSIEEKLERLKSAASDFPSSNAATRRLARAKIEEQIMEIELDSALYRRVRHDVLLANYFYHELDGRPGELKALLAKTEDFDNLACLQELRAMEKRNLIGGFTRRVGVGTLKIMVALENNLLDEDEYSVYEQLVARHVK